MLLEPADRLAGVQEHADRLPAGHCLEELREVLAIPSLTVLLDARRLIVDDRPRLRSVQGSHPSLLDERKKARIVGTLVDIVLVDGLPEMEAAFASVTAAAARPGKLGEEGVERLRASDPLQLGVAEQIGQDLRLAAADINLDERPGL